MNKKQLVSKIKKTKKLIVDSRDRSYWVLLGVSALCLAVFLLFTSSLTPYRPSDESSLYYISDSQSQKAVPYQRARVTEIMPDNVMRVEPIDQQGEKSATVSYSPKLTRIQLSEGDIILVSDNTADSTFAYVSKYRIPALGVLIVLFVALVIIIGGRRGASSVIGLLLSVLIIGWFIIPYIIKGYNALLIIMIGAYIIAVISVFVAHGVRRRTVISVGCILAVLTMVAALAWVATLFASLTGIADETALYLSSAKEYLDMRGILVGGIIIAALGVLDDIVTTQVATVEELYKANPKWRRAHLFSAASSVGGEHIASLVNTLALAYVGASLPYVIMLTSQSYSPLMNINGEYIATEVVRTLVASIGLVIAVPASTLMATLLYTRSVQ